MAEFPPSMMDDPLLEVLSRIAPGTALREAIDNIIRARTGALIIIGGEPEIDEDCEGGFRLDVPFHHEFVYELAKMDGAILLDQDIHRIRKANVELIPKKYATSAETGMRHRTAERIAKTRNATVIAVSERRSIVTIYKGQSRYVLHDLSYILTKATSALASLSRYDRLFRSAVRRLAESEAEEAVPLVDVIEALRRGYIALTIRQEINRYVVELGRDGHLIDLQLEEYPDIFRDWIGIWKDYQAQNIPVPNPVILDAASWSQEMWANRLGYDQLDYRIEPRGYRLLHTIRLPDDVIEILMHEYRTLSEMRQASLDDFSQISGIGSQRARTIWAALHETYSDANF
ncbi:DNA integrity scanning diadenylate cyclase DisA [Sulfobacillus thermosulfidooxidans]|uniref:DNA integrity scanning diadenylate cyclase DisA n=1 Tax=Sulfobacillus thermosulfidooxidans TaxID=28034 RepID=UPI0006B5EF54|nr:DNA integrity scanning diadenylate cyclase DisA [Sulfobacillus thermosulfidooxidans]